MTPRPPALVIQLLFIYPRPPVLVIQILFIYPSPRKSSSTHTNNIDVFIVSYSHVPIVVLKGIATACVATCVIIFVTAFSQQYLVN